MNHNQYRGQQIVRPIRQNTYPLPIVDNKMTSCCSCSNCKPKQPSPPFANQPFFPQYYGQPNAQNYGTPNSQGYGQNQWQDQNYESQSNTNFQAEQNQNYPNPSPPKQKNLFGSLSAEQLMTMLSSKGNFASILGSIGSSNPQLAMLMSLMQNMPQTKKQSAKKQNTEPEKKYIKVKDYYKENSDENQE